MQTFIVSLHMLLSFPSLIVIVCQPSLYHCTYYISFIGLDCGLPWRLSFPSLIVIVCQPLSYHCIYCISFIGLDCVLPWRLSFPSPIVIVCQPSSYHCTKFSFIGLDCSLPWRLSFTNCNCTTFPSYWSWLCITLKRSPYLESMDTFPSSILIALKLSSPIVIVLPTFVISLHILALAS